MKLKPSLTHSLENQFNRRDLLRLAANLGLTVPSVAVLLAGCRSSNGEESGSTPKASAPISPATYAPTLEPSPTSPPATDAPLATVVEETLDSSRHLRLVSPHGMGELIPIWPHPG